MTINNFLRILRLMSCNDDCYVGFLRRELKKSIPMMIDQNSIEVVKIGGILQLMIDLNHRDLQIDIERTLARFPFLKQLVKMPNSEKKIVVMASPMSSP